MNGQKAERTVARLLVVVLAVALCTAGVGQAPLVAYSQEGESVAPEAVPHRYALNYQGELKSIVDAQEQSEDAATGYLNDANGSSAGQALTATLDQSSEGATAPVDTNLPTDYDGSSGRTITVPLSSAEPTLVEDVPTVLVSEYFTGWTLGAGLLYWGRNCRLTIDPPHTIIPGYLRRMPSHGGPLADLPGECPSVQNMVADDSGLFATRAGLITWRPSGSPATEEIVLFDTPDAWEDPSNLVTDGSYLYWSVYNPSTSSTSLWRNDRTPTGSREWGSLPGHITAIAVDDSSIFVASDFAIGYKPKDCGSSCSFFALVAFRRDMRARYLLGFNDYLYWTEYQLPTFCQGDCLPDRIRRVDLAGTDAPTLYTASSVYPHIGQLVVGGLNLFWKEEGSTVGQIRRKPVAGGETTVVAENLTTASDDLFVDDLGLYFAPDSSTISRLPFTASTPERDFQVDYIEVTQGVQSLVNDVPLVGNKRTYVRIYARQISGPSANRVNVILEGWRDGQPLPDSPLRSRIRHMPFMSQGPNYDRGVSGSSRTVRLPDGWTNAGPVTLRATVDPYVDYNDPIRTNNVLTGSFTFSYKDPMCVVFWPVRTHTTVPPTTDGRRFGPMIGLFERLWPVRDVWVYEGSEVIEEFQWCWKWWSIIGYPCMGPFESDDRSKILTSLATLKFFTNFPDECSYNNYAVGMVQHGSLPGYRGTGRRGVNVSWVELPPPDNQPDLEAQVKWNEPFAGVVMAHELGHNAGRRHVNCGTPPNIDPDYPYHDPTGTDCTLDDGNAFAEPTHFGLALPRLTPIRPLGADDLMSYGAIRWTSDYTWKALFDRVAPQNAQTVDQSAIHATEAELMAVYSVPDLTSEQTTVLATGSVISGTGIGVLNYAWAFPASALNDDTMSQWQSVAAPARAAGTGTSVDEPVDYHLRLLDDAGIPLDDWAIVPIPAEDSDSDAAIFALTFPAPSGSVARLELVRGDAVLNSLQAGTQAPNVTIHQPAGGEVFDEPFIITWEAKDPDPGDQLLYAVQYSPDNGQTWRAIVTDFPGPADSATVNLRLRSLAGIPGSNPTGLIRVAASDGFHTTLSTSAPFVVSDQPPQPRLESPQEGDWFAAGEPVSLVGSATDPEDGGLSETALSWQVDGRSYGSGTEQAVDGLVPGSHQVSLSAVDGKGHLGSFSANFSISPLNLPVTEAPVLDGFCDDDAYAQGVTVGLEPYMDGAQASVQLAHTPTDLWACFSGLTSSAASLAGLRIDDNNSRDPLAQTDDYAFFVAEDGSPIALRGDGNGEFSSASSAGLAGRVSASASGWMGELRLSLAALNPRQVKGLEFEHRLTPTGSDAQRWPYLADPGSPSTWAMATLGTAPELSSLSPLTAAINGPAFPLVVHGSGFVDGATLFWEGNMRAVTFVSNSEVRAAIEVADLATARAVEVRVINPGMADAPSNPLTFFVMNPRPAINQLSPPAYSLGNQPFVLTVRGANFVPGAQVLWDGVACSTTFVSGVEMRADVLAADRSSGRAVGVVVQNPGPGGGISNLIEIRPPRVYVPLITYEHVAAPDLVVKDVMVGAEEFTVVVQNQGDAPVTGEFWVDGYINPNPAPTHPNQIWPYLGNEGMVWGVTQDVLPLQPGATLTLTVGDVHYWPELSHVSWPLSVDAAIYVQVDSANTQTNYGGVLETHDITGAPYNNIMGPVYPTATGDPTLQNPPVSDDSRPAGPTKLPPRQ